MTKFRPKHIYRKGRAKEYAVMKKLRRLGWDIVQRSAGSHSPVDVFAIHKEKRLIWLIQVKSESFSEKMRADLIKHYDWLSYEFKVEFKVI